MQFFDIKSQNRTIYRPFAFLAGMPPSTYKSILNGKSKNPGIVNINKIADALGVSIREFYNSDVFDNLDQDE